MHSRFFLIVALAIFLDGLRDGKKIRSNLDCNAGSSRTFHQDDVIQTSVSSADSRISSSMCGISSFQLQAADCSEAVLSVQEMGSCLSRNGDNADGDSIGSGYGG